MFSQQKNAKSVNPARSVGRNRRGVLSLGHSFLTRASRSPFGPASPFAPQATQWHNQRKVARSRQRANPTAERKSSTIAAVEST
jgi:hypothetical protein